MCICVLDYFNINLLIGLNLKMQEESKELQL